MTLGRLISSTRAWLGWSQRDLARKIGVSSYRVWRLEHDIYPPRARERAAIIRVFSAALTARPDDGTADIGRTLADGWTRARQALGTAAAEQRR